MEGEADGRYDYDCRVCRREGYDVSARVCFLRRDWSIVRQSGQGLAVDAASVLAYVPDMGTDIAAQFDLLEDSSGRVVCPMACVPGWAYEAIAEEIDAKEYGVRRGPMNRKEIQALRIVRSERARAESERMKKLRTHG